MAWEKMHRTVGSNGEVTMSPGYYEETVTLGNNADASTSALDFPIKSDITILATFSGDLTGDTYIQVEHSIDGTTWVKQGVLEEDGSVDHDDITRNRAKMAAVDDSLTAENNGIFWLYELDSNCKGLFTRFTVKANGGNESAKTCKFQLISHF
tara:strand:+ start:9687 stop:10145 length:459 start_codon:yes stop_codon:yes gene_type:complete